MHKREKEREGERERERGRGRERERDRGGEREGLTDTTRSGMYKRQKMASSSVMSSFLNSVVTHHIRSLA